MTTGCIKVRIFWILSFLLTLLIIFEGGQRLEWKYYHNAKNSPAMHFSAAAYSGNDCLHNNDAVLASKHFAG